MSEQEATCPMDCPCRRSDKDRELTFDEMCKLESNHLILIGNPRRRIAPATPPKPSTEKLSLQDALDALAYASEGRTNSVKPDLLANFINRKIAATSDRSELSALREKLSEARVSVCEVQCDWGNDVPREHSKLCLELTALLSR